MFFELVESEKVEEVKGFIKNYPNFDINVKNERGETALHLAAEEGNVELVELLLNKGANIDIVENHKLMTPLHLAVLNGRINAVKILCRNGANVNTEGFGLDIVYRNHFEKKPKQTPLFNLLYLAIKDVAYLRIAYIIIADILIDYGANIDISIESTRCYFHIIHAAVYADFPNVLEKIIKYKPSLVNKREKHYQIYNLTPLELAIKYYHYEIIYILIKNYSNLFAIYNFMGKLQKCDIENIREIATEKENEIKKFVKVCDYVCNEEKLPNGWEINTFSNLLDILGDSLSDIFYISKNELAFIKEFVKKILKKENSVDIQGESKVTEQY